MAQRRSNSVDSRVGDRLLSVVLNGKQYNDELPNELLKEFQNGYPLHRLRLLLRADDPSAVASGIWIASELGSDARPFLDDVVTLIAHENWHVRFFVLDCLNSCATANDERAITRALDLVEDREPSVRWKALTLLASIGNDVLAAAWRAAEKIDPTGVRTEGLALVINAAQRDTASIHSALRSGDSLLTRYAAAAAFRVAHRNPELLQLAMNASDAAVSQFAKDMGERIGISSPALRAP